VANTILCYLSSLRNTDASQQAYVSCGHPSVLYLFAVGRHLIYPFRSFLLSTFVIIGFFWDGVISPVPNLLTSEDHGLVSNAFKHPVLPITLLYQLLSLGSPRGLVTTNFTQDLTLPANATKRLKVRAWRVQAVFCAYLAL
jgi:hypothetical protein